MGELGGAHVCWSWSCAGQGSRKKPIRADRGENGLVPWPSLAVATSQELQGLRATVASWRRAGLGVSGLWALPVAFLCSLQAPSLPGPTAASGLILLPTLRSCATCSGPVLLALHPGPIALLTVSSLV